MNQDMLMGGSLFRSNILN
jgi:hypothetical protein